jgi:hypothetical protein
MRVRSSAIYMTEFFRFREESVLGRSHGKFVVEEEYKK